MNWRNLLPADKLSKSLGTSSSIDTSANVLNLPSYQSVWSVVPEVEHRIMSVLKINMACDTTIGETFMEREVVSAAFANLLRRRQRAFLDIRYTFLSQ